MNEVAQYYSFAELAFAAYSEFYEGMSPVAYAEELERNGKGMAPIQAQYFSKSWRVLDQYNGIVEKTYFDEFGDEQTVQNPTGLSVVIFENSNGNQVVAIRGTDDFNDFVTDAIDIAVLGTPEYQAQYAALSTQVQTWMDNGTLKSGFSVTGHSLGGFLAQALTAEFDALVFAAYTYNSPGFTVQEGITNIKTEFLDIFGLIDAAIPNDKISNIRALQGVSATAGLGQMIGEIRTVSIEDQFPNLIANHYMVNLVDALALYNLFATIDPSLSTEVVSTIIKAIPANKDLILEKTLAAVGAIYSKKFPTTETKRENFYANLYNLESSLPGQATITSLADISCISIQTSVQSDPAYLYALLKLNPFAITGIDYSLHNVDGYLEIENYSEKFIEDRSQFLFHLTHPEAPSSSDRHLNFLNLDNDTNPNNDITAQSYDVDNMVNIKGPSTYVFGTDEGEDVVGGNWFSDDHLYGMEGNDTISGGLGNDYIEGGKGRDTLSGGDGKDIFAVFGNDSDYDTFFGGDKHDKIIGGDDNDIIRVRELGREHSIEEIDGMGGDHNQIFGTIGEDKLDFTGAKIIHIESIFGDAGDDIITGSDSDDIIFGGSGNNTLNGGKGSDTVIGGIGQDNVIEGGIGADTLFGNGGNDTLTDRSGYDTYYAMSGDTIVDADDLGKVVFVTGAGTVADHALAVKEPGTNTPVNYYDGIRLSKGFKKVTSTSRWDYWLSEDRVFRYEKSGSSLIVTHRNSGDSITIQSWANGNLGISLYEIHEEPPVIPIDRGNDNPPPLPPEIPDEPIIESNGGDVGGGGSNPVDPENSPVEEPSPDPDQPLVVEKRYETPKPPHLTNPTSDVFPEAEKVANQDNVYVSEDGTIYRVDPETGNVIVEFPSGGISTVKINMLEGKLIDPSNPNGTTADGTGAPGDVGPGSGTASPNFSSPLVLDLNGNNITSESLYDNQIHFDLDGDNFKERVGWVEKSDGLLTIDLNQNGIVDNGGELFGNYTKDKDGINHENGFQALADYDNNSDSKIDIKDEAFQSLNVWVDADQDGVTDAGELKSLDELNIKSINLNATETGTREELNFVSHESTFTQSQTDSSDNILTDENGNTLTENKAIRDVWFKRDARDTTYEFEGVVPADVLLMPDISGSGRVINLGHAMAIDVDLKDKVNALLADNSNDLSQLYSKADDLLASWTGTEDIDPSEARGVQEILNHNYANPQFKSIFREYAMAQDVAILEAFSGQPFQMYVDGELTDDVIGTEMAKNMADKYAYLRESVVIDLLAQDLYGKNIYDIESGRLNRAELYYRLETTLMSGAGHPDFSHAATLLAVMLERDQLAPLDNMDRDILLDTDLQNILLTNDIELSVNVERDIIGHVRDTSYLGNQGGSTIADGNIHGGAGDDQITGGYGDDVIRGGAGNDVLNGERGNDIIKGGAGDDVIYGGGSYGNDVLEGGQGDDTIQGSSRPTTYKYTFDDGNDVIKDLGQVGNTPDTLILNNISSNNFTITRDMNDLILKFVDSERPEYGDVFGSVRIVSAFAQGKIERFEFSDRVLDFDEMLEAGHYTDNTHTFSIGDGTVLLDESGGTDALFFGAGITPEMIMVKVFADSDHLVVAIKEEGTTIAELSDRLIINHGAASGKQIESFAFVGGETFDLNGFLGAFQPATDGDDIVLFADANIDYEGLAGNDIIRSGGGDDVLSGGAGSDTINSGLGDDAVAGGSGDDSIVDSGGNDTYLFNLGDGRDAVLDLSVSDSLNIDKITFGPGINGSDLIVEKSGNDLLVGLADGINTIDNLADVVTLQNWYLTENRIESFEFADGSSFASDEILSSMAGSGGVAVGLETDDTITGDNQDNFIFGMGGNDTLAGDAGNDELQGGEGDDRYIFNRGDDVDRIIDKNEMVQVEVDGSETIVQVDAGQDTLVFGDGINVSDVVGQRSADDLVFALKETGKTFDELSDKIRLKGWYNELTRIESIEFADGTAMDIGEMLQLVGTEGNDDVLGVAVDTTFTDSAGNDTYSGLQANDTYTFGHGGGEDVISDVDGIDKLTFKNGILSSDLEVVWGQGTKDVVVQFKNSPDRITLKNWYDSVGRIETFEFEDGTVWDAQDVLNAMGTERDDVFNGFAGVNNSLNGNGGDDIISTYDGNDFLAGGAGDDGLDTQAGNDTLVGGEGADSLWGGSGDDVYVFNQGDGRDLILDADNNVNDAGSDTLRFGAGISREWLTFKVDADSDQLLIGISDPTIALDSFEDHTDIITIEYWYQAKNRIETIELTETGELLTVQDIMALMGTDGPNTIKALAEGSQLDGGSGNDTIYGNTSADELSGGSGDDQILGREGDDILAGNAGTDFLNGESGNDLYLFGIGDGSDTIYDAATITRYQYERVYNVSNQTYRWEKVAYQQSVSGGDDTIKLGDGIVPDDLDVKTIGNDVIISLKNSLTDKITIKDFYGENSRIEKFIFSDGQNLAPQDILNLLYTEGNDTVTYDNDAAQIVMAKGGNDTVVTGQGADQLTGGAGNDILNGGRGNDVYYFGQGDGRDLIKDYGAPTEWWHTSSGDDTIHIQGGLTRADVIVAWGGVFGDEYQNDLIIALKDEGKTIDLLTDRILVKDWFNKQTQIENLTFDDGSSLDGQGIMDAIFTDGDETINLSLADQSVYINALGGADTLLATSHNDFVNAGDGNDVASGAGGNDWVNGEGGDDVLSGNEGGDYLSGGTGNDTLVGDDLPDYSNVNIEGFSDQLSGNEGDDTLIGAGGNDILIGGTGSDNLQGGLGDDHYIFDRGDGTDILIDDAGYDQTEYVTDRFGQGEYKVVRHSFDAGNDTIFFGEEITADDVVFYWDHAVDANGQPVNRDTDINSNDLIVALKDPANPDATPAELSDKIIIRDWYKRVVPEALDGSDSSLGNEADFPFYEKLNSVAVNRVENFRFVDGTVLSGHDLIAALQSDHDDRIEAVDGEGSVLYGLAGNDVLTGHLGDDQLSGGEGNDRLDAGYGWNTMDGGIGDDTYILSSENTPPWVAQESRDVITDIDGFDRILFLNDIAREDILFTRDGDDLLISYGLEQQHDVRIVGNSVERFEMSDGSFITREQINSSLEAIALLNGTDVSGVAWWNLSNNLELKSILYNAWTDRFVDHQATAASANTFTGNSENESVTGGSGPDNLAGHSGNDQLYGGAGDDFLNAGNGNDTYSFERGDNNDTILDAEDPDAITGGTIDTGDGGYGDYGIYGDPGDGDTGGAEENVWEPVANAAPSDDTLALKGDIRFEDLEAYWATDVYDANNDRANDLLLKINPVDGSDTWNNREANIDIIVNHYSGRSLSEWIQDPTTNQWIEEQRQVTPDFLAAYSDKALRQFSYQLTDGYINEAYTNDFGSIRSYLEETNSQTAFFEEYRQNADSILIKQFYDKDYTIEDILLEAENRVLSADDVMELLSSDNSEMIRGVDWSDNTISAEAGDDAVVGGELNDIISGDTGSDLLNGMEGDDTYLFNKGDGRDTLKDGDYYLNDMINESRSWASRAESFEWGSSVWNVDFNGAGDWGGFDVVRFGVGIDMQNVDFVRGGLTGEGSDLYIGFGDKTNPANVDPDWVTEAFGNAESYGFNHGDGNTLTPDAKVYQDDIFLPDQFSPGKTIEEFVLADGTRITSDAIAAGLDARQAYINQNEAYLNAIEVNGRDAKGYADQVFLDAWQRVAKTIAGTDEADILSAGDGDDIVSAGAGDDVINAGFGADLIAGGAGDDAYLYNRWDGQDKIVDSAGLDSLVFGPDILLSDLVASLAPDTGNLTLGIIDEVEKLKTEASGGFYEPVPSALSQKIVIENWHGQSTRLENFVFSDGAEMSAMDLYNHFFTSENDDVLNGLEGDNTITARGGNDSIILGEGTHSVDGGSGNDHIVTGSGADTIFTGTGADIVHAGAGNDVVSSSGDDNLFYGEAGNDSLYGGFGRDAYHFNLGDGNDMVLDAGGIDALVLGEGITFDDTWIVRQGNDVSVALADGNHVLLKDWDTLEHKIENIVFGDGLSQSFEEVLVLRARNYELDFLEDNTAGGVIELGNPGDGVVYSVKEAGANGQLTVNPDGSWNYRPNENFNGADQAIVEIRNSAGEVTTSTLRFNVLPVNDAPTVDSITGQFAVLGSGVLTGVIEATDIDGDSLTYLVSAPPGQGVLSVDQDGGWSYEPGPDFSDSDTTTVLIADGKGGQVEATLNFSGNIYENGELVVGKDGPEFLQLKDISKDDLHLSRNGDDLYIAVRDKGSITLTDYFAAAENGVDYLETLEGPLHLAKEVIIEPGYHRCKWFRNKTYADADAKSLVYGSQRSEKLLGGDQNDVVFGAGGRDKIYGRDGDDTLIGGDSRDRLYGGDGADTLYGDADSDALYGQDGNDVLVGGDGNDLLNGDEGDDWLFGDAGRDMLYGGEGNDTINSGRGDDKLYGGRGDDVYLFNKGDGKDRLWDQGSSGYCSSDYDDHDHDRFDDDDHDKHNPGLWKSSIWRRFSFRKRDIQQSQKSGDTVRFGEGIGSNDIALYMQGGDLQIQYGEDDAVKIYQQGKADRTIERFELADGSYLTDFDVNRVVQAMSSYAVTEGICMKSIDDVRNNESLMSIISNSWHQA